MQFLNFINEEETFLSINSSGVAEDRHVAGKGNVSLATRSMCGYVDNVGHLQTIDYCLLCCLLPQKGCGLKDMGHLGCFIFCMRKTTKSDFLLLVYELGDSWVAYHQEAFF